MEKTYARALWEMIGRGAEPRAAVQALHHSLQERGRQSLMPRIAVAFAHLAGRESKKNAAVLSVAREKDAHTREIKEALGEIGVDPRDVTVTVDPHLIGGWRFEGGGRLVDASYKKYLLDVYNRSLPTGKQVLR